MKKIWALIMCAVLMLAWGCTGQPQAQQAVMPRPDESELFSDRDRESGYSAAGSTVITLSDGGISVQGGGAAARGSTLIIEDEGDYLLRGSLSDGQIIVDAGKDNKLRLILDGVSVSCSHSAPLYVKKADKVFVTLAEGSQNSLQVTGDYVQQDDNKVDAAVFSKEDITFNGSGSLTVGTAYGHGIVSKDDLKFTGGSYTVEAEEHALSGKDCLYIAGGSYTLSAGGDGIRSHNDEEAELGGVYIGAAQVNILRSEEGIEGKWVTVNGGSISLNAADDGINATDGANSDSEADHGSHVFVAVYGGEVRVSAGADGIDSNGSLVLYGGLVEVSSPGSGKESPIDCNGGTTVYGGTLLAAGCTGVGRGLDIDAASTQPSVVYAVESPWAAGTEFVLKDAQGAALAAFAPEREYSMVQLSLPQLTVGQTYTLCVEGEEFPIKLTDTVFRNK